MKRASLVFTFLLAGILLMTTCTSLAEEKERRIDWGTDWGYGIQLTQPDGNYFTTPFLSNEQLSEVCVYISSNTYSDSNMMLVVFYKDQLVPFYAEEETEPQYQYKFLLEEYGEITIRVSFDREMLDELIEPETYLHFVIVGHLTRTAENPLDYFFMEITQPVKAGGNSEADAELSFENCLSIPQSLVITHADGVSTKNWSLFTVDNSTPEFTYTIGECWEDLMLYPVLNGELLMESGKPLTFLAKSEDGVCSGSLQLTLQEGKNTLFFIQMPTGGNGTYQGRRASDHYTIIVE